MTPSTVVQPNPPFYMPATPYPVFSNNSMGYSMNLSASSPPTPTGHPFYHSSLAPTSSYYNPSLYREVDDNAVLSDSEFYIRE